jgi:hypothetical protein
MVSSEFGRHRQFGVFDVDADDESAGDACVLQGEVAEAAHAEDSHCLSRRYSGHFDRLECRHTRARERV